MTPSKSWLSEFSNLLKKWNTRYMGQIEIIIIVALVGYILGLIIFLFLLI